MNRIFRKFSVLMVSVSLFAFGFMTEVVHANEVLRIFTWDGYVTEQDVKEVNKLLEASGNPVRAQIIETLAADADQMFNVIRADKADLSFLTLNYIKMDNEKTAKLLQPIDVSKIPNYTNVIGSLKNIPMGLDSASKKPLYVPFGGGSYGIWANMKKIKKADVPKSLKDLLDPKWKGKISLTDAQFQPNVALAMLATGKAPFYLNDLIEKGNRDEAAKVSAEAGEEQKFLDGLYSQVGSFWGGVPAFPDNLWLVASYGIEIAGLRAKGEDWQLVKFSEGDTVWLDTMNIMKAVSGKKLEAAYVFINYFLGKEVQNRVVNGLSMVSSVTSVKNPLIEANANFFDAKMFWPPYLAQANNLMKKMHDSSVKKIKK